ncbi:RNA methyltransferase [Parvibium lacunae]|uniref:tRNA (cytidine/uridine-2'-O-)-methyltransferase TrmJ n=2 Tax=Parvibium lacunae TaxID=1888893 RepID=A0A368L8I1_9BURK|nr:RNA methyltransferase [Parvibium lacunae]
MACLARIRLVLVETSHPGNVGAVARAAKNMGLSQVVLVQPRYADVCQQAEAIAFASGATDVLEKMRCLPSLAEALADCDYAVALSARPRDLSPALATPRAVAEQAIQHLQAQPQATVALVFGSERYGLSNEQVMQCQRYCMIPTDAAYSSLNLAQAVQILTYECRLAAQQLVPAEQATDAQARYASLAQMEQFYAHLEAALIAVRFLNPAHPKKLMPRLRRLFGRLQPELEEWQLLRGLCTAMLAQSNSTALTTAEANGESHSDG